MSQKDAVAADKSGTFERAVSVPAAKHQSKATREEEDDTGSASSGGTRRHSVTFITDSSDPTLDRRRLQRTPTPYSEETMAEETKEDACKSTSAAEEKNPDDGTTKKVKDEESDSFDCSSQKEQKKIKPVQRQRSKQHEMTKQYSMSYDDEDIAEEERKD